LIVDWGLKEERSRERSLGFVPQKNKGGTNHFAPGLVQKLENLAGERQIWGVRKAFVFEERKEERMGEFGMVD
jgi:hypothetical protein